jgi:hypothetical protein
VNGRSARRGGYAVAGALAAAAAVAISGCGSSRSLSPAADSHRAAAPRVTVTRTAGPQPTVTVTEAPQGAQSGAQPPLPVLFVPAAGYRGIEPSMIGFSGDAGNIVTGITWSSWTAEGATGTGISDIQGCVPNCAQGSETPVTTTISISAPVDGMFTAITEMRAGASSTFSYPPAPGGPLWPEDAS